jgi:hypothetical protein
MDRKKLMKLRSLTTKRAFTVTEALIAAVIIVIAIIGTSMLRYQSALGVRKADLYSTSVRLGLMLCEGWTGEGGTTAYNPVTVLSPGLNISTSTGIAAPTGFTKLNSYKIVVDSFNYYATLSWKDMGTGIISLHIVVSWDQRDSGLNTLAAAGKIFKLTTYVRKSP